MTLRATAMSPPPDEDWVDLRYSVDGSVFETRIPWRVFDSIDDFKKAISGGGGHRAGGRRSACFAPGRPGPAHRAGPGRQEEDVRARRRRGRAPDGSGRGAHQSPPALSRQRGRRSRPARSRRPTARSGTCASSPSAWSSTTRTSVDDFDEFFAEVRQVLSLMPKEGLILDVRANGGGYVYVAEALLQDLTPRRIQPEPTQFINTPVTAAAVREGQGPEPVERLDQRVHRDRRPVLQRDPALRR